MTPFAMPQVGDGLKSVGLMAKRLTAAHRWCVTGTPMNSGGLADLQGLLGVNMLHFHYVSFSSYSLCTHCPDVLDSSLVITCG